LKTTEMSLACSQAGMRGHKQSAPAAISEMVTCMM